MSHDSTKERRINGEEWPKFGLPRQRSMDAQLEVLSQGCRRMSDEDVKTEPAEQGKVAHSSGATSSHFSPFTFYNPFEGAKLTCQRFLAGNHKHENDDPVYLNANWLKAYSSRDVAFFRDRGGHALEHLIAEMRGEDDLDPGGNLGAVGWFQEVMAYVKKNDPFFYGAIQGKWSIDDHRMEQILELRRVMLKRLSDNPIQEK